jgi:hypothetical protein
MIIYDEDFTDTCPICGGTAKVEVDDFGRTMVICDTCRFFGYLDVHGAYEFGPIGVWKCAKSYAEKVLEAQKRIER